MPIPRHVYASHPAAVDLYWIPLGAGGYSVAFNGRVFEAVDAARRHRPRCDLYHAALVVESDGDRYTLELAPSPDADEKARGVVATGAVGSRHLGWLRLFRYEVRCWRGGSIPDLGDAVGGPRTLTSDPLVARRLLGLVTSMPRPVWGRDELNAGEMWNSNSMIAWLIATAGLATGLLGPPARGRAPGWHAGLELARRGGACCGRPAQGAKTAALASMRLRARSLRWGSTDDEVRTLLPGDELMPHADLTATRAITIRASVEQVWPWIAQLGQGRGGFYSYDGLENLVGCDIHTRLLVRERYAYKRPWARFLVEPAEALSFLMSQKMLRGIKTRAEQE